MLYLLTRPGISSNRPKTTFVLAFKRDRRMIPPAGKVPIFNAEVEDIKIK